MHTIAVSLTCFMMILAPCLVAVTGRMKNEELD